MQKDIKHLIRIANVDLEGKKPVIHALQKIKGVGHNFANAVCNKLDIDKTQKAGSLTPEQVKKIEKEIKEPSLPDWLLNRRKDYDTGKNIHLITSDLKLQKEFDVKRLQKIKSYRGIRHALKLPLRGQRTRGHFRKGKSVGVQRKGIKAAAKKGKK